VTAIQELVAAMGCASLLTKLRIVQFEHAAANGIQFAGGGNKQNPAAPHIQPVNGRRGLNEVGLTDGIMSALWRLGPFGASYAVTANVENLHLASDIAFIHRASKRIRLYQAKVASLHGKTYKLKSSVTAQQVSGLKALESKKISIGNVAFDVSVRLALYQAGVQSNRSMSTSSTFGVSADIGWGIFGVSQHDFLASNRRFAMPWPSFQDDSKIARLYYDQCLHGAPQSPCGVLAAPVLARAVPSQTNPKATHAKISDVGGLVVQPWEFDFKLWTQQGNSKQQPAVSTQGADLDPPEFEQYEDGSLDPASDEFVEEVRLVMRRPRGPQIHLVII
jgi:hypothetical protein